MAFTTKLTLTALLAIGSCAAQSWEFGGFGGYSIYRNGNLTTASGEGSAGFRHGVAFGAVLGNDLYRYVGGEFRYTFIDNSMKLDFGGQQARMGGESHAFHYDFLVHAAPRGSVVRPFIAAGAGGKFYRGTGEEVAVQPLMQYAVLTHTSEWQPLLSVGAGVKVRVSHNVQVRFEVRDYATPFPKALITPMRGSTVGGWLHNFVPMAGVSAVF
ncbi:MAG TPA: outer membrane beta-barrel protein [Bryobacteraceae bacterium]|nr:outer membrane beta-barrel protein [Bryobacteraceae bacterium]